MRLIDHAPETREDKTQGWQAGLHTEPPRCPGRGQRHKPHPHPARARLCPGTEQRPQTPPTQRPAWRQPRDPHLHGLRRLPDQASCLCLLQGLRASHPQRALGSGLGDSKAGFLRNSPGEQPRQLRLCGGCGAAVQMETAARISGGTSSNTSAASLL